MNYFYLISGILVVAWGFLEGLWTTIWVDGNSAPLTGRLTTFIWKIMRGIIGKSRHRVLSLSGPVILVTTVSSWIILIILGWALIFYADPFSIQNPTSKAFPGFTGHVWYITYVMFSVGNGDFTPQSGIWQLLSSMVAFGGMAMVTLAITYILQVLSAVVSKRSFSSQVTSIGKSPEEFVTSQWTGDNFGDIELQLNSLSSSLANLTEQHMAYPILHYYHAANHQKANAVTIAILDDALSIIKHGVPEEHHPSGTVLKSARSSVTSFLDTLRGAYINPSDDVPPMPNLQKLKEKGVPIKNNKEFEKEMENLQQRRKSLYGFVQNSAWEWPPIKKD